MPEYVRRNKRTAGEMTQLEAGAIAEIVSEEAFKRGLNVWIDSSMRNADWWSLELDRLKRTYPHRLCILYVTADWEAVQAREQRRGEQTERRIPPDVLRSVFNAVPKAIQQLSHFVDECIHVDNNVRLPTLVPATARMKCGPSPPVH